MSDTDPQEDPRKLVITLGVDAARSARGMAAACDTTSPEVVRRGLSLYRFWLELGDKEELVIRNRDDGSIERVRFQWDLS